MIFAGSKTVELRRVCPKISSGDLALVYVSSPVKELRGAFEIRRQIGQRPLAALIDRVRTAREDDLPAVR